MPGSVSSSAAGAVLTSTLSGPASKYGAPSQGGYSACRTGGAVAQRHTRTAHNAAHQAAAKRRPILSSPVLKHSSGTTRRRQYQDHYTVAPCCGPNKTAPAAVLHGSMFSKPMCGSASAHKVRAAAQAAALRLLYHGAAKRPRQNRIHCGFAWFNVLKSMRESASAHEERAAAQAADLRLLYHIPPKARSILHAFYNHPYLRINP